MLSFQQWKRPDLHLNPQHSFRCCIYPMDRLVGYPLAYPLFHSCRPSQAGCAPYIEFLGHYGESTHTPSLPLAVRQGTMMTKLRHKNTDRWRDPLDLLASEYPQIKTGRWDEKLWASYSHINFASFAILFMVALVIHFLVLGPRERSMRFPSTTSGFKAKTYISPPCLSPDETDSSKP